jgi:hypothetical protein
MIKKCFGILLAVSFCAFGVVACSGGGGGSGSDSIIEGTLATDSTTKVLAAGQGGIAGVTISALGDTQVTDSNGNFTLKADGNSFTGGPVLFAVAGDTVAGEIAFDMVTGGPGVTAYVDLKVLDTGAIVGTSMDAAGNIVSEVSAAASLGCTNNLSFQDGGGNALWKPVSESTGTVVILMPGSYRNASFGIFNANGDEAASVLKRHCCEHNGGRDHIYLTRSASSLASEPLPLTVTYDFKNGRVDCLPVSSPTSRLD